MARRWNEWERQEITTKCADPTVVVMWTFRWKNLTTGCTEMIELMEFQGLYSMEVNGQHVENGDKITGAELIHKALEAKFQSEIEAAWELQHGQECEHGYFQGCRACDPDGR